MQDMKTGMTKIIESSLMVVGECPMCHSPMYQWKIPHRGLPVCMECGYREDAPPEAKDTLTLELESKKAKAYGYLKNNSIIKDRSLFHCSFSTFEVETTEQANAVTTCKELAEKMAHGNVIRLGLVGSVGVGKSHLAMSSLYEVLEKSKYKYSCLFIDFMALLNEFKFAMNDAEASRALEKFLMKEIEKAHVVVIDDIGAEVGDGRGKATPYTIERLTDLLNSRHGKSMIYTTNLSSKNIREIYGERVASRLLDTSNAHYVTLKETTDYRLKKTT